MRKLIIGLIALSACGKGPFKIGANVGPAGADVARMAASEIRQSRAARDRRVEERIAVNKAVVNGTVTPAMLGAALDSMADDEHVGVVVSRFLDESTLKAAQTLKSKGMPFISVTPLPDGITAANGPGFSLVPGYTKQAEFLAQQATAGDRVAIVHIRNAYGESFAKTIVSALQARGLSTLEVRSYDQSWDEPRMVALGADLQKTKDPTVVYFIGRAPSFELVWQPFRESTQRARVYGSDLVESSAVYENPEGKYTGLQYVRFVNPKSQDARTKELHDRYALWIGRGELTGEAMLVYDAMMVIREALRAGARTHEEISQYFASLGHSRPAFKGVGGDIAFGADGAVARPLELVEVTADGVKPAGAKETKKLRN